MGAKLIISFLFLGTLLLFSYPKPCLASSSEAPTPKDVINSYLKPHNKVRASLGLSPFEWSEELANYARWWAHVRQGDCAMIHSHSDHGENLFWGSTGKEWTGQDAVDFWAGEKKYYDYKTNTCASGQECAHYTQIAWKQSKKLGCAKLTCTNGYTFITCNYDPHGNIMGQRPF
ncbi:pathogenesis-related protein PRB1-3 [Spinacia oleracea]|uniref:Pathogenesis-related protein PRB1-3 n=1 Tax=Spinacia oleracea TaxID=3562 RepID=A0ABM3RR12_SPIOL|nr:pathogenesis-related protein PRB1-3-like [Spinacia oleracea]